LTSGRDPCFNSSGITSGVSVVERHLPSLNRFFYLFLFQFCSTLLPRAVQKFFSVTVGDLFYLVLKKQRAHIRANIEGMAQGCWPSKRIDALTRKTFQNYGQYLLDYMVMHRLKPSNASDWVAGEVGGHHMIEALQGGRGVICVTPHLGNWEMGGLLFSFKGGILNVLTLDERDGATKSFRERMRSRRGIKNIYLDTTGNPSLSILDAVKALQRNEIVAMLGDRAESQKTMFFDFFGKKTRFPIGPGVLAMATGAPVLPVFVVMEKDRKYRGFIEGPIYFESPWRDGRDRAIQEGMEKLVKMFEYYISRYPDQWYNFYAFWGDRIPRDNQNRGRQIRQ
jgi:Kdo2-lipid IVA lauroyltransferase/acyltransferase